MVIKKFHSKRKAKSGKRRQKKRRKLETNESVVEDVAKTCKSDSVSNIVFDEIKDETVASKRKLLLNNAVKNEEMQCTGDRNILISESILQNLVGVLQCPNCANCNLKITSKDNAGFSFAVSVCCSQCGEITCQPENSVNVNQRIVIALRAIGAGRAQLNSFSTFMNLGPGLCKQTFSQIMKSVHLSLSAEVKTFLALQMNIVRQYYTERLNVELDPDGVLNIIVSFDGTWHRRGHQSNHGIGFVIEVSIVKILKY